MATTRARRSGPLALLAVAGALSAVPAQAAPGPAERELTASYGAVSVVDFYRGVRAVVSVEGEVAQADGGGSLRLVVAPAGSDDPFADPHRLPMSTVFRDGFAAPLPSCAFTDAQRQYAVFVVQDPREGVPGSAPVELALPEVDTTPLVVPGPPRVEMSVPTRWTYGNGYGGVNPPQTGIRATAVNVADGCGALTATTDVTGLPAISVTLPTRRDERWEVAEDPFISWSATGVRTGRSTATVSLDTDGRPGDGLTQSRALVVDRALPTVGNSFVRVPTPRYTGLFRMQPYLTVFPGEDWAYVERQPGPVALKIYQGSRLVWYSGVYRTPASADIVLRLPALPRGTYQLVAGYGGNQNVQAVSTRRSFTVR